VPKRVDHGERRRQIADALLRTAAARGLHATGMREVAAEAGVSLRLVQYYFGTKEQLLLAGMQHLAAQFGERAMTRIRRIKETGGQASPRDVIAAILAEALPADDERRTFAVLNAAYFALALTDSALAIAPLAKNTNAVIDVVAAQLRAAQAAGDTPAHLDPDAEALSLLAMSAGLANSVLAALSSAEQAQAVIDYHLNRLFPVSRPALRRGLLASAAPDCPVHVPGCRKASAFRATISCWQHSTEWRHPAMSADRPAICRQCGKPLPRPGTVGRVREYCGPTCRSASRRDRARRTRDERTSVKDNLTKVDRKAKLDIVRNESTGATGVPAERGRAAALGLLEDPPGGTLSALEAIAFVRGAASAVEEGMRAVVQRAREAGHTWEEIGQVLGTTRQAAFQRFGRPVDPRTGQPMALSMLPGAAERGAALFADLAAGRWADASRDFGERIAGKLDADGLAVSWARLAGMLGQLEGMGEPAAFQAGDRTVVDVPLSFEAGERTGRVSYDHAGKVAGLFFLPPGLT